MAAYNINHANVFSAYAVITMQHCSTLSIDQELQLYEQGIQ